MKEHKQYDPEKIDVFALGVTFFNLLTQRPPFIEAKYSDPYYRCFASDNNRYWKFWANQIEVDEDWKDLINHMLDLDENKRYNL